MQGVCERDLMTKGKLWLLNKRVWLEIIDRDQIQNWLEWNIIELATIAL